MSRSLSVLLCIFVLAIAACGPLPRPFGRDKTDAPNPLAHNVFREGVEVAPVSGTTLPMGKMLAEAVIARLEKDYEIPAAMEGLNRSRYILTGHVRVNDTDPNANALISIGWQLDERDGKTVAAFVDDIPASRLEWDYGSVKILDLVGETVGERVARMVLGDRFDAAESDRLLGRRGLFVGAVSGAPGDGNAALRRAISVALGGGGVKLVGKSEEALFNLGATVDVADPEAGAQAVRIVWTVTDVDDRVLGRAEQANAVPAGSLDGQWGRTAAFVAAAAMDGIVGIIAEHDPNKLRAPDLGIGPPQPQTPPPSHQLPQIPGRAPPPPS